MTWFGPVSAWAAAAVGLIILVVSGFQFTWGIQPVATAISALLLLIASFRTLRAMSGGLRLLAGAWGLSAGLLLSGGVIDIVHGTYAPNVAASPYAILPWIALAGLVLTVLHKEQKK